MSALDELKEAASDLAALLKEHYMLPNTWPASRRFLAAVEALEGAATADGPQSQSGSQSSGPDADVIVGGAASAAPATLAAPAEPLPQEKPQRRAPPSQS